jgi:hypothetical protein
MEDKARIEAKLLAIQQNVLAEAQAAESARRERTLLERQLAKAQSELAAEREARLRAEQVMLEMQARKQAKVRCLRVGACQRWTCGTSSRCCCERIRQMLNFLAACASQVLLQYTH